MPCSVEWLEELTDCDRPYFLYLSHKAAHGPFAPEPKYKDSLAEVPFTQPKSAKRHTDNDAKRPRGLLDQSNCW